jgi:hypothetical protein
LGSEGLVEGGFEEVAGLGLGGGELGFQAVAESHQFIDFGDDAVLLGVWALALVVADSRASSLLRKMRPLSERL